MSPSKVGCHSPATACGNACWRGQSASVGASVDSPTARATGALRRGLGLAMGLYKGGTGREGEAEVRITPDGRVQVAVGGVDVGQGSTTVLAQIAAEALGVPVDRIDVVMADTDRTPPAHVTAGSSTTITTGAAVKLAAEEAKRQLLALVDGIPQAVRPRGGPRQA